MIYSIQSSDGGFSEEQHQSVIEYMQELTGRQLDDDVIEIVLSESDWKGNELLPPTVLLCCAAGSMKYCCSHSMTI